MALFYLKPIRSTQNANQLKSQSNQVLKIFQEASRLDLDGFDLTQLFSVTFSLKLILDYLLSLKLLAEGNSLKILSIIIFPSNVTNDFNFYCIRCWKNDDKTLNRYKDCDFNANIAKRKRKRNSLSFDDGKSILRKQILPLSQFFTSH